MALSKGAWGPNSSDEEDSAEEVSSTVESARAAITLATQPNP